MSARAFARFCRCHAYQEHRRDVPRFASIFLSLLHLPSPTDRGWHRQNPCCGAQLRSPIMTLKLNDCAALLSALREQAQSLSPYPLTDRERTAVELSYSGGFASRRCTPGSRAYWMNLRRERLETIGRIIDLGASLGRDVWLTRPLRTEGEPPRFSRRPLGLS